MSEKSSHNPKKSLADDFNNSTFDYKDYQNLRKNLKKLTMHFITNIPKDILIEALKDKKVIKRDWIKKREQYETT